MLLDQFKARAEEAGSEVHRFETKIAALQFVIAFLQKERVADRPGDYAVWADCLFLQRIQTDQLAGKVPGLKFNVTREEAAAAKIGISQMDWAAADTGTLMQESSDAVQRLASSLPEIHVAIIASDRILRDLTSLFSKVNAKEVPYIAFITGPRGAADIQKASTIDVHVPKRLIIVIVDRLNGSLQG